MIRERLLGDRVLILRQYFAPDIAARAYAALHAETRWLQPGYANDTGGTTHLPRLTANYGERSYDYSRLVFTPEPWTPRLAELKTAAEHESGETFNAAILQLYRDGKDSVNWHSDDIPGVGTNPVIASLSFGGSRWFHLRHKVNAEDRHAVRLGAGDLLVMRGDLQHQYLHKVPREPDAAPRINITFRRIFDPPA